MFNSDDNMNTIENFTSIKMNISENLDRIITYSETIINKSKSMFTLPQLISYFNNILLEIEDDKKQLAKQYILECEDFPKSLYIITKYCSDILNNTQNILSDDEIDKYSSIETYTDKYTHLYNIHIEYITSLVNDNLLTLEQFNTKKEYAKNRLESQLKSFYPNKEKEEYIERYILLTLISIKLLTKFINQNEIFKDTILCLSNIKQSLS